ncbi:uncharacterized protein LOC132257578 [Phlebotomus argentipes]|uniref:uncharacterized protein LOC132257578 n=1 Tax=Phlebotomus argentipes TaxID=94469 RepID=UPI0028930A79|nr:uncharacterized protein LOC132257578 [Phlebotomus argentipes]
MIMTHSGAEEDEFKVSVQNYNKLTDIHHKSGFKDGISAGREQKYQEGFDAGFRDGFHHAFLVGKCMGMQKDTSNADLLLKNPQLGHCQICLDQTLLNKDLDELVKLNCAHTRRIHEKIEERYKNPAPDPSKE